MRLSEPLITWALSQDRKYKRLPALHSVGQKQQIRSVFLALACKFQQVFRPVKCGTCSTPALGQRAGCARAVCLFPRSVLPSQTHGQFCLQLSPALRHAQKKPLHLQKQRLGSQSSSRMRASQSYREENGPKANHE